MSGSQRNPLLGPGKVVSRLAPWIPGSISSKIVQFANLYLLRGDLVPLCSSESRNSKERNCCRLGVGYLLWYPHVAHSLQDAESYKLSIFSLWYCHLRLVLILLDILPIFVDPFFLTAPNVQQSGYRKGEVYRHRVCHLYRRA